MLQHLAFALELHAPPGHASILASRYQAFLLANLWHDLAPHAAQMQMQCTPLRSICIAAQFWCQQGLSGSLGILLPGLSAS